MTINSMEALEAMPVGGSVKVTNARLGTQVFERVEGGFKYGEFVVDPKWFAGHVAAAQVIDFASGDPEIADYFISGNNGYIILGIVDSIVHFARFRHTDGRFTEIMRRPIIEVRGFTWRRSVDRPQWFDVSFAMATVIHNERQQMEALRIEVQEMRVARDEVDRKLADATQLRAAQVQVVANGVSPLPLEKAAGETPPGTTVLSVYAAWARQYTVTTEPARGCQCGAVTRASVAQYLGIQEGAEFTFTVDCGRH